MKGDFLMTTFSTILRAAAAALVLTTGVAQADLSAADKSRIDGKSGLLVRTSDGAYIGITNGLYFEGDRIRMFIIPNSGSKFRPKVDSVTLTTYTTKLTLRGADLFLDASRQKLRAATPSKDPDDSDVLEVTLLGRR